MTSRMEQEPADTGRQRAVVHIGTHKTGTTSFQAWARRFRRELAARTGLHYYDGRFKRNHHELAMLALRHGRLPRTRKLEAEGQLETWRADVLAHVRQQVERPVGALLCSAEDLSYVRHTDEVERLVELLRPRQVSVIAVLRNPADFLRSYEAEFTRQGVTRSSDPESVTYVEPDSWLVRYDDLLDAYRDVLGPDRVTAISYEDSLRRHGSIIPAILEACGADVTGLPPWDGLWQHRSRGSNTERARMKEWWRRQQQAAE